MICWKYLASMALALAAWSVAVPVASAHPNGRGCYHGGYYRGGCYRGGYYNGGYGYGYGGYGYGYGYGYPVTTVVIVPRPVVVVPPPIIVGAYPAQPGFPTDLVPVQPIPPVPQPGIPAQLRVAPIPVP